MNKISIFTQLKSLAKTTIEQVKAGCPIATQECQDMRAKICSECEFLLEESYRCGECGCFLKWKLPWATSECPKKFWGKEEAKENE